MSSMAEGSGCAVPIPTWAWRSCAEQIASSRKMRDSCTVMNRHSVFTSKEKSIFNWLIDDVDNEVKPLKEMESFLEFKHLF